VHVLVIPKFPCITLEDFTASASQGEVAGFLAAVAAVARLLGLADRGYRVLVNNGPDGRQEVPHLHFHIFGGRRLGAMLPED
jgi:diadenosine tetraphosphate (Ap4A) HIT family hydrolase